MFIVLSLESASDTQAVELVWVTVVGPLHAAEVSVPEGQTAHLELMDWVVAGLVAGKPQLKIYIVAVKADQA